MTSNSAYTAEQRPSMLVFNKSTVIVWVAISLIVIETFSGALRFYFDQAGISALLYLPKVACIALFLFELQYFKANRMVWVGLLLLLISGLLAMLHGASLNNLAFSLFGISPLLFALVCSGPLIHRKRLFCWAIGLCLLASIIGIALDKYTFVPWKGYSYSLGETQLAANTAWSTDETDRIAGFARVSNALSIIIAIFSLYLAMFIRSRLLLVALCAVAFYSIILTTSKAPAGAFVLTLGMLFITRFRWTSRIVFVVAVLIGLALPILGLVHDFDPNAITSSDSSLSSLYDRLINTWPNVVNAMSRDGWTLTGAGFGLFGSTLALFPVPGTEFFSGSDSSAVYLWGVLGVAGILLYLLQIPLFCRLADEITPIGRALLAIGFCICLISWTTDMFEVAVANLFMGLSMGHVLTRKTEPAPASSKVQELHSLPALSNLL